MKTDLNPKGRKAFQSQRAIPRIMALEMDFIMDLMLLSIASGFATYHVLPAYEYRESDPFLTIAFYPAEDFLASLAWQCDALRHGAGAVGKNPMFRSCLMSSDMVEALTFLFQANLQMLTFLNLPWTGNEHFSSCKF